jgi:hypothetical protein
MATFGKHKSHIGQSGGFPAGRKTEKKREWAQGLLISQVAVIAFCKRHKI